MGVSVFAGTNMVRVSTLTLCFIVLLVDLAVEQTLCLVEENQSGNPTKNNRKNIVSWKVSLLKES
jgi:hypothetical protein